MRANCLFRTHAWNKVRSHINGGNMKKRKWRWCWQAAAQGVAHIGAIEELERQGFEISAVAGTSMGALVGGVYASGYLEPFKEWMRALDKYKVFSLVDFALSTEGAGQRRPGDGGDEGVGPRRARSSGCPCLSPPWRPTC